MQHTPGPWRKAHEPNGKGMGWSNAMTDEMQQTCSACGEAKPLAAYRGTRRMCRECEHARKRAWYAAQPTKPHQTDEGKQYYQDWYAANSASVKSRAVAWAKANPGKRGVTSRENMARQRDKLATAYVRRMLAQSMGLQAKSVPDSLVDAQRELLKLKRYLNEKRG